MTLSSLTIPYCISCSKEIQDALYDSTFLPNLFIIIVGFLILTAIVLAFSYFSFKKYKKHASYAPDEVLLNPVPLSTTSVILGIGLGGFVDGILFHQILQLHGMVSNRLALDTVVGKVVNMFWDGIFHAVTLVAVIIGVVSLVRLLKKKDINPSSKLALGGAFAGWGIFNVVEGTIHHHIIKLHNVNEYSMNPDLWNYSFLASGVIFMALGFSLIYNRKHYPARLVK